MILLSRFSRLLFPAIAVLVLASWGCGSSSNRSRVQGKVSYNSEPVDDGGIAFIPEAGSEHDVRSTGPIQDGRYEFDGDRGPYPGKYRVEIYWNKKTGRTITGKSGAIRDERTQGLPAKYNTNSELKVEIKPGLNTIDFDLKP